MNISAQKGSIWLRAIIAVVAIFGFLSLSLPRKRIIKDSEVSKNLSNARQIHLGLMLYAEDHNGTFPKFTTDGKPLTNSNEAYRNLLRQYVQKEALFYSRYSNWTPNEPDEQIGEGKTLVAGENHWAYIPNLTKGSNQNFPLIATGFAKDRPGTYGGERQTANHRHPSRWFGATRKGFESGLPHL